MYRQNTNRQYTASLCSLLALTMSLLLISLSAFSDENFKQLAIICPPPVSVVVPNNACEVFVQIPGPTSNNPSCPLTSVMNDLTGMNDPSGVYQASIFIITWQIEDQCGATMTCIQTVQVSDVTSPQFVCPIGFATDCVLSESPPYADLNEFLTQPGSMATDNCSIDETSFTLQSETLISGTPCNGVIRRTYAIEDPSGNVSTCNQNITILDNQVPAITCPNNITVSGSNNDCSADISIPIPLASDNCLIESLINNRNNTPDASGNYPVGQTIVVWTVTDVCGLSATCQIQVQVEDASAPSIVCPESINMSCIIEDNPAYSDLNEFIAAGGDADDDCGIVSFGLLSETSDGNVCPETVSRVYFVMDANNNRAICTQQLVLNDSSAPSFTAPDDITLSCTTDIENLSITGEISDLTDNCNTSMVVIDYLDNFLPGDCPSFFLVERVWIAIDQCDNTHTETQLISLISDGGPTAICRDITVFLDESGETFISPEDIDDGSFSDCGGSLTLELDIDLFFCNDVSISPIEVVLIVTDLCNNSASCIANVMVTDTLAPQFVCPGVDTVQCSNEIVMPYTSLDLFISDGGEAFDNCMLLTGSFILAEVDTLSFSCPSTIQRRYELSDIHGNTSFCIHTIIALDTIPPVIESCPEDIAITLDPGVCDSFITVEAIEFTDNCGVQLVTNNYTGGSDASGRYFSGSTEVIWSVTDTCGNESTCITIIVLSGNAIISCPADTLFQCDIGNYLPAETFEDFLAIGGSINDNCGLDPSTFVLLEDILTNQEDCNLSYSRIYAISDDEGTQYSCTQTIFVSDTIPPAIGPVINLVFNNNMGLCGRNITITTPSVSDNCDNSPVIYNSYTDTDNASGFYPIGQTTVWWYAEDNCGNIDSIAFTVTINDAQSPLLTCPPGLMASCSIDEVPPYADLEDFLMAGGTASDNCLLDTLTFEMFNQVIIPMMGFSTGNRQYRIFDIYGNSAICNQNILIIDLIPPTIVCPANISVNNNSNLCEAEVNIPLPIVNDNCGVMSFINSYNNLPNASDVYPVGTTVVSYTVFDFRGNTATCSFEVNVRDTENPVLTCPANIEGMCDIEDYPILMDYDIFVDMGGNANDNCEIDQNSFKYDQVSDFDKCPETYTRTYFISDIYGNEGSCVQLIEIHDKTAPTIICPSGPVIVENMPGECYAYVDIEIPAVDDNCGVATLGNNINNLDDASGMYRIDSTTVIFTVTDFCGNTATCSLLVIVPDTENPMITCPPAISAQCSINQLPAFTTLNAFISAGGEADDNCGVDGDFIIHTDESNGNTCPEIIIRTYTIRDIFGNEASCEQMITIQDLVSPGITCPANVSQNNDPGECNRTFDPGTPITSDNCGISSVINSYNGSDSAEDTYPVGSTVVTWIVLDICGNSATCSMMVIITDNEPPVVIPADTINTQCNVSDIALWTTVEDFESAGGSASDNCDLLPILEFIQMTESGLDTFVRTYRLFDIYGNHTVIAQVIIVKDDIAPTFLAPVNITADCAIDLADLDITGDVTEVDDNCDDIPVVSYTDQLELDCTNGDLITRTWRVTDYSGNSSTAIQLIRLIDDLAPVFDQTPIVIAAINCDAPFPTPQVLTATDNCKGVTVTHDILPFVVNNCTGYTVTYRWTATDDCGNSSTTTRSFEVLPDTQAPVFGNIPNITVSTNPGVCVATVNLMNPAATDNCSTIQYSNNALGNTFPLGETIITWTATDACSNSSTATQTIIVRDTQSPNINCRDLQISLSSASELVPAELIIVSATDNCTLTPDLTVQARRMQEACGVADSDEFSDTFILCCADAGSQVTIIVRVTDEAGNFNECMRLVEVKDVQPPIMVEPLPDISVSCEFGFTTANLSIFGTYRTSEAQRQQIIINDHFYTGTNGLAGRDGLVDDNCPDQLFITESFQDLRVFNQGQIIRTFIVTDASGNSIQLQQIINVIEIDPFDESDIIWPPHTNYNSCPPAGPPVSETGEPTWTNKKCAVVGSSFKDWVFTVPGSGCRFVERKWKVVELAQNRTWEYTQFLTQVNNIAPTITSSCADITVCANETTCQGNLSITASATDDCTNVNQLSWQHRLDLNNNGTIDITGNNRTLSSVVPQGNHRITWIVNDGCGNSASCSYNITVRDCKAPLARCLHGLSTDVGVMQMAMAWATDFNHHSTDNCTPAHQLRFSFSADLSDNTLLFGCEDLGLNAVDVWVTDLAGNQSVCNTYILITDTGNHCGLGGLDDDQFTVNLSGKIFTPENTKICDAEVYLLGAETDKKEMTNENGEFLFEKLPMFNTYVIQPERDTMWMEGVSTLDLVLIQRHILELQPFTSPYQFIAADVNNSKGISVADLIELRKLILGVYNKFPANKSWRFIDVKSEMGDPTNPWPFNEERVLDHVYNHTDDADFIAVKIGDVSGSVSQLRLPGQVSGRNSQKMDIYINDIQYRASEVIEVLLYPGENTALCAFQISAMIDGDYLKLLDVGSDYLPQFSLDQLANFERDGDSYLNIAYHYPFDIALAEAQPFIKLRLQAINDGSLSKTLNFGSFMMESGLYQLSGTKYSPRFNYIAEEVNTAFQVSDGSPNPFREQTQIQVSLEKDQMIELQVFDNKGLNVLRRKISCKKGINPIVIRSEELPGAAGIFFVQIKTQEGEKEVRKILRID